MRQREKSDRTDWPRVQLSFIGHSMGGFVVTNAIRTLSDVFAVPVDALNSYGAGSPPELRPQPPENLIDGKTFELKALRAGVPGHSGRDIVVNARQFSGLGAVTL